MAENKITIKPCKDQDNIKTIPPTRSKKLDIIKDDVLKELNNKSPQNQ